MARIACLLIAVLALAFPALAAAREDTIESFDGTTIALSFFPTADPGTDGKAPTVMIGPGWSQPRDGAESGGLEAFGYLGPKAFLDRGYNVLTWDPRGFNQSEGTVTVDSPEFERRDTQELIDYVAEQPEALLDGPGDPRLGMEGASYGGGIQLVTAAFDRRIDAIIPVIAWHSLVTSLLKDHAVKAGWSEILVNAGLAASHNRLDPHITDSYEEGLTTGDVRGENRRWFESRGPGALVSDIRAPTLLVQGTADTLFTLEEAIRNFRLLRDAGVPVKMRWFCGGHGTCVTDPGDTSVLRKSMLHWFARYLKGRDIATGPRFRWVDQDGVWHSRRHRVLETDGGLSGSGAGPLPFSPGYAESGDPIAATPAANAVHVAIDAPEEEALAVGAPKLRLTYSGTAAPQQDTHVYAQIVDLALGVVMGPVVRPIPVTLDGQEHTVARRLEPVAWTVRPGGLYELQIAPSTQVYGPQRSGGAISFSQVGVSLPLLSP